MSGFVRRYTAVPPQETILQIEGVVVVDTAPPASIVGAGSGALLCVGEFEDGLFATDIGGTQEVFSPDDKFNKFGGFGYSYAGVGSSNPSARRHLFENWNGNGYLKLYNIRAQRLFMARVDTSVGSVAFAPLAIIKGGAGPFQLAVGQQLSVTTSTGGPASSTAIAATVATTVGVAGTFPTLFTGGQSIGISVDGAPAVNVVFSAADQSNAQVVARINLAMGYTAAVVDTGQVRINALNQGTAGRLVITDAVAGTAATLGIPVGSTSGTGNVGNLNAVTAAEVATILNATAAWNTQNAKAQVGQDGTLRVYSSVQGTGTILITAGAMQIALGLSPTGVAVAADSGVGGTISAGTRVRTAGALEWVTMQTLVIPAGNVGPWVAKVRPATDDGTGVTTALNTVTVMVDQPSWATLAVNNAAALTAALTEVQIDNAYIAAMNATLNEQLSCRAANYLLSARRSDSVVRQGIANAASSFANGLTARKFVTGDPVNTTTAQIVANVANFRSDRSFYTGKGMKVRVSEIAARGTAGGVGFTADGVITVRPDGPLAMVCCLIPPEDNPAEATGLIELFFEVDAAGEVLDISSYIAFKAAGVVVPKLDRQDGMGFQSGVTSSLTAGLLNISRRKMADFIQDSFANFLPVFSKKLNTRTRRDSIRAVCEQFLGGLQSIDAPDLQRIDSFLVDDGPNAGNTAAKTALGIHYIKTKVRTLSSLDDIVMVTEIGEGVITTAEVSP